METQEHREPASSRENARLRAELAELKKKVAALEQSDRRFRTLFEQSPLSTLVISPEGRTIAFNRAWQDLFEAHSPEFHDYMLRHYNMLEDPALEPTGVTRSLRAAIAGEAQIIPPIRYNPPADSGKAHLERWLGASVAPVKDEHGKIQEIILVHHDITAIKQAEEELRRSRDQLRVILEGVADGITVTSREGKYIYANSAAARFCGFGSAEELLASNLSAIVDRFEMFDEDGRKLGVRDLPSAAAFAGRQASPELVVRFRFQGSGEDRWSILSSQPVFGEEGNVLFVVSIFRDFTDRKKLETSNAHLFEETRKAVQVRDEFLSIAAHELRTPLTSLSMQLQILRRLKGAQLEEKASAKLEMAQRQTDSLARLIDRLLDLSRLANSRLSLDPEPLDLVKILSLVVESFRESAAAAGSALVYSPELPSLVGEWDALRLEQAVTNLLSNALKYGEGRPVEVRIFREGGFARVRVTDQGMGIAPEDQARIFGRFERAISHTDISGLGIGLYITRQIAAAHGGDISLASQPGKGSAFTLSLPLREESASKPGA